MKYSVGQKVKIRSLEWYLDNVNRYGIIECGKYEFFEPMNEYCGKVVTIKRIDDDNYRIDTDKGAFCWTDEMIEGLVEEETKPKDMGEVSDGYHTFNELYEYRMLYNAALFNEFAKQGLYDVHKSRKHADGEYPFGDSNWFIVMAELPTGQISNHYEMKDWDKFQIPEKPLANKWDEHSPRDVAERLREFLPPKPKWPKTPAECCKVLGISPHTNDVKGYKHNMLEDLQLLLICRDAYWKLAGDYKPNYVSGVDKFGVFNYDNEIQNSGPSSSWERHTNKILDFPSFEIRNIFPITTCGL